MILTIDTPKGDVMPSNQFGAPEPSGGQGRGAASLIPDTYKRFEAPAGMQDVAELYEGKFDIKFETLHFFSDTLLHELHRLDDHAEVPPEVEITSRKDASIIEDINVLSDIANNTPDDPARRAVYFETLKTIYGKLASTPADVTHDPDMLFLGIEREGRALAEAMGWLPRGHNCHPHAKRIPYQGGLLVGVTEIADLDAYFKCVIIDGAIASGATIISLIQKVRPFISSYRVYSVHSTLEGLHAINRYCTSTGLDLSLTVGHATRGLNEKFYAVALPNTKMLVVGDLGDTISSL
jgi:hypothetical protein